MTCALCCVLVFVQVASSEWFLAVQIQDFENPYNAEIRMVDKYCCCDDGEVDCAGADISAVNNMHCINDERKCDPYEAFS